MEGLEIIENSYNSLQHFKSTITADSFSKINSLCINLKNYDMKTQSGLKTSIGNILEIYKDELNLDKPISKILTGDIINIQIPNNIDGFRDDLVDCLKCYIEKRAPELWISITSSNSVGGIYSV